MEIIEEFKKRRAEILYTFNIHFVDTDEIWLI